MVGKSNQLYRYLIIQDQFYTICREFDTELSSIKEIFI